MTALPTARLVDDRDVHAAIAEIGLVLHALAGVVAYVAVIAGLTLAGMVAVPLLLPIAATRAVWRAA